MNGLKYIRTRCNLSLNELADILGVSRQALSMWETEKRRFHRNDKNSYRNSLVLMQNSLEI